MPASGTTANFKLPQYKPLDTVSMLVTFNGAMQTIDEQMQNIKNTADTGTVNIDDTQKLVASLVTDIAVLKRQTAELQSDQTMRYLDNKTLGPGNSGFANTYYNNIFVWTDLFFTLTIASAQKTPMSDGTPAYTLFTTPNDLYTARSIANANYVGQASIYDSQGNNFDSARLVAWRENNITYFAIRSNTQLPVINISGRSLFPAGPNIV